MRTDIQWWLVCRFISSNCTPWLNRGTRKNWLAWIDQSHVKELMRAKYLIKSDTCSLLNLSRIMMCFPLSVSTSISERTLRHWLSYGSSTPHVLSPWSDSHSNRWFILSLIQLFYLRYQLNISDICQIFSLANLRPVI